MKDLSHVAKDIEDVFIKHFPSEKKPALAIAFTLAEEQYLRVHWVTNISRQNCIKLFRETAGKMLAEMN